MCITCYWFVLYNHCFYCLFLTLNKFLRVLKKNKKEKTVKARPLNPVKISRRHQMEELASSRQHMLLNNPGQQNERTFPGWLQGQHGEDHWVQSCRKLSPLQQASVTEGSGNRHLTSFTRWTLRTSQIPCYWLMPIIGPSLGVGWFSENNIQLTFLSHVKRGVPSIILVLTHRLLL